MIDLAGIEAARQRIAPHVRRTPTLAYTQQKDGATDRASVIMKLELVQAAGSFKARGAMNRLLTLDEAQLARGIVTASGGNHGIAVAHAARALGMSADVFVPRTT
ncbi:MAG: pyridoxal-phosphate dependent enzyme, partial [Hyphomicrobiales bacterium]|nr:pyridoxal-phosphate dependent enzyme [Hyphomicrobiales bacterium]